MPGAHKNHSVTPLLTWTGERKYDERLEGRNEETRTERNHSLTTVTKKTD